MLNNLKCLNLQSETAQPINPESVGFSDQNFKNIVEIYYNGDKVKFMEDKEVYYVKIERLKTLISELKLGTLGYTNLLEIKKLLAELGGMSESEFDSLLKNYNYDFDKLYSIVIDPSSSLPVDKMKSSEFIGTISGSTMSIEYNYAVNYEKFIRNVKK